MSNKAETSQVNHANELIAIELSNWRTWAQGYLIAGLRDEWCRELLDQRLAVAPKPPESIPANTVTGDSEWALARMDEGHQVECIGLSDAYASKHNMPDSVVASKNPRPSRKWYSDASRVREVGGGHYGRNWWVNEVRDQVFRLVVQPGRVISVMAPAPTQSAPTPKPAEPSGNAELTAEEVGIEYSRARNEMPGSAGYPWRELHRLQREFLVRFANACRRGMVTEERLCEVKREVIQWSERAAKAEARVRELEARQAPGGARSV